MAENDKDSKTEEPTAKRMRDARNKGNLARSEEVGHWFILAGAAAVIALLATPLAGTVMRTFRPFLEQPHLLTISPEAAPLLADKVGFAMALVLLPILFLLMLAGLSGQLFQNAPTWTAEKMKPELKKISPLSGLKRIFSLSNLVDFTRALVKLAIVVALVLLIIWPDRELLPQLITMDPLMITTMIMREALLLLGAVLAVLGAIAAADLLYQRWKHVRDLRMTKQEVKDEHKQAEGDPHVKARLRSLRSERSRQRMMQAVPRADVVITNPTHYAVALEYDSERMAAPTLIAKGADLVAKRIRDLAKEHDIPIVSNPPLARALFAHDVGREVPEEQYKAVAEVIGYVLRLDGALRSSRRRDEELRLSRRRSTH